MKIYTRTGDNGTTALFFGRRVPKTHGRIEAIGAIDELNAALGVARVASANADVAAMIQAVQRELFVVGGELAAPGETRVVVAVGTNEIARLEEGIDRMTEPLPALRAFILPGGTSAAAHIHLARTICRRAEREVLRLEESSREVAVYMNRLADFLFTLARFENLRAGVGETEWHPDAKTPRDEAGRFG